MRAITSGGTSDRGRAPLIPDSAWSWIGWLIGALAVVVVVFAALTTGRDAVHPAEEWIVDVLTASWLPSTLWDVVLAFGSPAFFIAVVVALAVWAIRRRDWPALVACATVPGAVLLAEQIMKPIVDRRWVWGDEQLYYPSGTVTGVAAWTTLTWLLAVPLIRTHRMRLLLGLVLGGLTLLTALAVVGSARHFPFDAIGGVATGMGVVLACASVIDRCTGAHAADRADSRRPPTGATRE